MEIHIKIGNQYTKTATSQHSGVNKQKVVNIIIGYLYVGNRRNTHALSEWQVKRPVRSLVHLRVSRTRVGSRHIDIQ